MEQRKGTLEDMGVDFWSGRNVFVTGAAGLLGSALVAELVARRARVTCLIRDRVGHSPLFRAPLVDQINVVEGELEDFFVVERAINEYEIDSVFHLGAQTIVGTALRSALSTFESNVRGTWNVLEACRRLPKLIQRVVVASSDKAYGANPAVPYTEDLPTRARFPYDVSKACAELVAMSYHHTFGVPVAISRCGNLFGGGDLNFNRLVPGTIRAALSDEPPVIRSDGKFLRDYLYVRDGADAYLTLAEALPDGPALGEAFNFGNETPVSVLELVTRILRITGKENLEPRILDEAQQEIRDQYLDCRKARELLNWQPRYALDDALAETIAWYRNYFAKPNVG